MSEDSLGLGGLQLFHIVNANSVNVKVVWFLSQVEDSRIRVLGWSLGFNFYKSENLRHDLSVSS